MRKERMAAAEPIARDIGQIEASLNHSLVHIGSLLTNIAKARLAPGTRFGLDIGMEASNRLSMALTTTLEAYQQIVDVHAALAVDRSKAGLDIVNWGPEYCPRAFTDNQESISLRLVV